MFIYWGAGMRMYAHAAKAKTNLLWVHFYLSCLSHANAWFGDHACADLDL